MIFANFYAKNCLKQKRAVLWKAPFKMADLEEAFTNFNLIPDFAIQLFTKEKERIAESLKDSKHDPVAQAIARLDTLLKYINEQRKTAQRI